MFANDETAANKVKNGLFSKDLSLEVSKIFGAIRKQTGSDLDSEKKKLESKLTKLANQLDQKIKDHDKL